MKQTSKGKSNICGRIGNFAKNVKKMIYSHDIIYNCQVLNLKNFYDIYISFYS
jgi:hypothetical protein